MAKLPALPFYPGDWFRDRAVACLSLAAQGLWFNMLLIMNDSPRRGELRKANLKQMSSNELARLVGANPAEVEQLLSEMQIAGTFSTLEDGTIYNRRMVRESKQTESKREAGRQGGLKAQAKRKQVPSVSSSFSTSVTSNEVTSLSPSGSEENLKNFPSSSLDQKRARGADRPTKTPSAFGKKAKTTPEILRLAEQLSAMHPETSAPAIAAKHIQQALAESGQSFDVFEAELIARHAAYLPVWQAKRAEDASAFVPNLAVWLSSGEWKITPELRKTREQARREREEKSFADRDELDRQIRESTEKRKQQQRQQAEEDYRQLQRLNAEHRAEFLRKAEAQREQLKRERQGAK